MKEDLIRETAKLCGFSRIGANVENAMSVGIQLALINGNAITRNERITLEENYLHEHLAFCMLFKIFNYN